MITAATINAAARVAVPTGGKVERVRQRGDAVEIRKFDLIYHWGASGAVVPVRLWPEGSTLLPPVVNARIVVAEICERGRDAVHFARTIGEHPNVALDDGLGDGTIPLVPMPPSLRWELRSSVVRRASRAKRERR